MSIKKIGVLFFALIIATGFLNLDAGRRAGRIPYPASDVRSRTQAGRQAIGLERRETAKSMAAIVNGIRDILYNDNLDAATKIRMVREQVTLFGKSEEEIRQIAARKDAEAAAKVKALEEATRELERKQAAANANPENPQVQRELVQAKAGWSRAQKAMLAAVGTAALFGTTYLASRYTKPGEDSWEVTKKFAHFAPAVEDAFRNMGTTTQDLLGLGEGKSALTRIQEWWRGSTVEAENRKKTEEQRKEESKEQIEARQNKIKKQEERRASRVEEARAQQAAASQATQAGDQPQQQAVLPPVQS